ncbi:unnamed protein product [Vitrella brassicaformis CCMP3155]|uniref:Uncharacterized protein n=1 Tax=Vitrella brassicaformis (strain CCMP3155) TaxID=1169540 RepID=A0A0G4EA56_VITBC|nr:unnamed protein product [Vitrella brassicaformis CCMP3155]|eukprot:CEL92832.1 unnamed protein product [Vitrella brassicaformis CCMP3155]
MGGVCSRNEAASRALWRSLSCHACVSLIVDPNVIDDAAFASSRHEEGAYEYEINEEEQLEGRGDTDQNRDRRLKSQASLRQRRDEATPRCFIFAAAFEQIKFCLVAEFTHSRYRAIEIREYETSQGRGHIVILYPTLPSSKPPTLSHWSTSSSLSDPSPNTSPVAAPFTLPLVYKSEGFDMQDLIVDWSDAPVTPVDKAMRIRWDYTPPLGISFSFSMRLDKNVGDSDVDDRKSVLTSVSHTDSKGAGLLLGDGDLIELVVNESHPVTLGDMVNPFGGLTSELGDKESDGGARAGFPLYFWGRARLVSERAKEVSVSVGGRRCQVQCYDRLVDNEWSLKVGYSLSPLLHRWTPQHEGMMKQRSEVLYRYNDLFELERVEALDPSPLSPPHSRTYIHFGPPFPDLFRLKIGTAVKGRAAFGVEFFSMPANFTHRCPPHPMLSIPLSPGIPITYDCNENDVIDEDDDGMSGPEGAAGFFPPSPSQTNHAGGDVGGGLPLSPASSLVKTAQKRADVQSCLDHAYAVDNLLQCTTTTMREQEAEAKGDVCGGGDALLTRYHMNGMDISGVMAARYSVVRVSEGRVEVELRPLKTFQVEHKYDSKGNRRQWVNQWVWKCAITALSGSHSPSQGSRLYVNGHWEREVL